MIPRWAIRSGGLTGLLATAVLAAGCGDVHRDTAARHVLQGGTASVTPRPTAPGSSNSAPTTTATANSSPMDPERGAPATPGCVNGAVTDAIRAALVQANRLPGGHAVPGHTYYGTCGAVSYAVARFEPVTNATLAEQVSFQDDGSDSRFFMKQARGAWTVVGQRDYDLAPTCATFTQLPSALKTLWQNCPRA